MSFVSLRLQSVLLIGSAHNKGGPPNINIVQTLVIWFTFMYKHSKPEKCQYSFSKSYFTNIAFQNVSKAFVYIMDCNPSLNEKDDNYLKEVLAAL